MIYVLFMRDSNEVRLKTAQQSEPGIFVRGTALWVLVAKRAVDLTQSELRAPALSTDLQFLFPANQLQTHLFYDSTTLLYICVNDKSIWSCLSIC